MLRRLPNTSFRQDARSPSLPLSSDLRQLQEVCGAKKGGERQFAPYIVILIHSPKAAEARLLVAQCDAKDGQSHLLRSTIGVTDLFIRSKASLQKLSLAALT
jgi:hypothetical protein